VIALLRKVSLLLVGCGLLAASCASQAAPLGQPDGETGGDPYPATVWPSASALPTLSDAPEPTSAPEATTTATTTEAQRPAGSKREDWAPLTVSLSATCLERGDELTVTATSTPNAGLGFAVGYSKPPNGERGVVPDFAYFDHESNPTGTIRWAFVVRPTVPYGPGVVKVIANGADGRGAFQSLDIEIAESCA
jgi:hypothetical protein